MRFWLNKPDITTLNGGGSIPGSASRKARQALGADIFLVLMTYPDREDFDLYGNDENGNCDRAKLYHDLKSIAPDLWITVWATGEIRYFGRDPDNAFALRLMEILGAQGLLVSPFVMEEVGFGYACWAWRESNAISNDEILKADLATEMISLAIKVYQNEKSSKERGDKLSALLELSTSIYSSLNYREVLQKAVKLSMEIMLADGGTIFILDKEELVLRPLLTIDERYEEALNSVCLRLGEGITGKVAQSGVGIISNHSESDPRSLQVPGTPVENESLISAPLTWSGDVIGVITLWSYTGKMFTREDLEILTIFARQTADAIENAKLFESLEKAYEELTATQDQLIMAEKLKALGDMAGGVAHDFNNALGTILGHTQLLLNKISDPESKKELEVIEQVTLKGRRTVQRLQDFTHVSSRSQHGRVELNRVIKEAIEATKPAWKDTAQRTGITINLHADLFPGVIIDGSHEELQEAISNVILNAVDALPDGGNIWIKTFLEQEKVVLQIADDGIGMDENTKNKLFFPFFSTKGSKGFGMGLAVVYGILFRHQADIGVESSPGKGAIFIFKFNISRDLPHDLRPPEKVEKPKSLYILLVDDDTNLLDVVGDMLEFMGHKCQRAESGKAALEAIEKEEFALVMTDLGMPEVSGWDVARFSKDRWPRTPVILISGWGAQLDGDDALRKVDAVLPKPFQLDELEGVIEKVMFSASQTQFPRPSVLG
jgi:signal transduction histidine kinase/CheY-like chemotaxis protein